MGFDGYSLVDAILMVIVGWQISKFSQAWTIIGLLYWIGNMLYKFSNPQTGIRPVGIVSVLILLGFINGLRGILAYAKFVKRPGATDERT